MQRAILIHITVVFRSAGTKFTDNTKFRYDWFFIGPNREYK